MMHMRIRYLAFVAAAAGLICATTAEATTVTATFNDVSPGMNVSINPGGSTRAGVYNFTQAATDLIGINPNFPADRQFGAFCIDVNNHVNYGGTYTWQLLEPLNAAPVPVPGGGQIDAAQLTDLGKLYTGFLDGIGSSDLEAAAFQACVWEIVFETCDVYNLKWGAFMMYSPDEVRTRGNQMLGDLDDYAAKPPEHFLALVSCTVQDQLVIVYTGGQEPIPEPLTMFGVFGGVAGVAGYVRRRRRA